MTQSEGCLFFLNFSGQGHFLGIQLGLHLRFICALINASHVFTFTFSTHIFHGEQIGEESRESGLGRMVALLNRVAKEDGTAKVAWSKALKEARSSHERLFAEGMAGGT